MSYTRAFSSLGCPNATLDEALTVAKNFQLQNVELRALGGSVELAKYFAQHFGSPQALAEKLSGSAVRIVSLDTSLHLINGTAQERDELLAFVPWAEALSISFLRVFDGGKTGDAAEIARAAETMAWWNELRRKEGWRTQWMIETHDSLFTSAAILRFVAASPGAKILWDTHHTWKRGGESPVKTWQAIREHVVHIHVKDSISQPSARHPFTYVLPGDGEFPAAPLFELLRSDPYAGSVSLEWELLWHPYLPSLETALQVAQDRRWW